VARRIREEPWARHALLVAVTGWGQEADKQRSAAAGIDHHLIKPVEPATLKTLLADFQSRGARVRISAS
jgi:CheY-like chemotaxis protein